MLRMMPWKQGGAMRMGRWGVARLGRAGDGRRGTGPGAGRPDGGTALASALPGCVRGASDPAYDACVQARCSGRPARAAAGAAAPPSAPRPRRRAGAGGRPRLSGGRHLPGRDALPAGSCPAQGRLAMEVYAARRCLAAGAGRCGCGWAARCSAPPCRTPRARPGVPLAGQPRVLEALSRQRRGAGNRRGERPAEPRRQQPRHRRLEDRCSSAGSYRRPISSVLANRSRAGQARYQATSRRARHRG